MVGKRKTRKSGKPKKRPYQPKVLMLEPNGDAPILQLPHTKRAPMPRWFTDSLALK
jgi:hypothetical protein